MRGPSHRGGRQRGHLPSSMILLDEAHAKSRTTYSQEPVSPRGGKRPRTTSSIAEGAVVAAAATVKAAAAADSVSPTVAALLKQGKNAQHEAPLFRLRRHLGSTSLDSSYPRSAATTRRRRTPLASTDAAPNAARLSPNSVDTRGDTDTAGEAEAMVADEERSSPLTSPHHTPRGGNSRMRRPTASSAEETEAKKVENSFGMFMSRVDGAVAYRGLANCGGDSPSAPAYEPPPNGEDPPPLMFAREMVTRHNEGIRQNKTADRLEGTHQDDGSSPRAGVALPQAENELRAREAHHARQEKAPLISSSREEYRHPSPGASRDRFLSTMSVSDDACKRVREDLSRYMEGVRKRTSADGTPCVAFPRNFDRVVGLMGRNDLEERSLQQGLKIGDAKGGKGCPREVEGKGTDCPPPWTKYLLDEGLDNTKTFSRYKGVFADEQTGEHRLMRGMAKMRELDIRLARTTQRARDLKLQAREAGEQAERAAGTIAGAEQLSHRSGGRGPIAMDDMSDLPPQLPLHPGSQRTIPAPLASPAGSNSRRTDTDEPPSTQRSERSAAGGSQRGGRGGDGRAKDMAFVTQKFQGLGRRGPSSGLPSVAASSSNPAACSSNNSPSTTGTSRGRMFGGREGASGGGGGDRGCAASGAASSGGGDRGCAGSGGGSSGVSFVVRNKRHAARARRRLTDEQESLVSRFMEDADGFDGKGELIGEPAGVWAEIGLYGGLGASEAAARLTEIDAQLMAMGGALLRETEEGSDGQASSKEEEDGGGGLQQLPPAVADESHGCESSSRQRKTPPRVTGDAPGESALREQRKRREDRCRERAIDTALEKLRDSLFETSTGGEVCREEAVDQALELARSAPLNVQAGVRQGAGRIDSLLGGEGPQPIGEWEVKHALRQGEEELRGKDLATRERIEELLATVRRESAGCQPSASNLVDSYTLGQSHAVGDFPPGTSLDAFFSLAVGPANSAKDSNNTARGGSPKSDNCIDDATFKTPRAILSGNASENQESSKGAGGGGRGGVRTGGRRRRNFCQDTEAGTPSDEASEEGQTLALRQETSDGNFTGGIGSRARAGAPSGGPTSAVASQGPQPARRPRPRKEKPAAVTAAAATAAAAVPPEISALFRAPLLASRVDPPIAGVAAAAVASGGAHRRKPRTIAVTVAGGSGGR